MSMRIAALSVMISRRLAWMDTEIIFTVEESLEGGYEAQALGHDIFTQADSLDELKAEVQDAVRCHFEEKDRPKLIRLHFVKDEVISA